MNWKIRNHLNNDHTNLPKLKFSISDYSDCDRNVHKDELLSTMKDLQCDSDRDVRYFISNESSPDTRLLDTSDSQSETGSLVSHWLY